MPVEEGALTPADVITVGINVVNRVMAEGPNLALSSSPSFLVCVCVKRFCARCTKIIRYNWTVSSRNLLPYAFASLDAMVCVDLNKLFEYLPHLPVGSRFWVEA